MSPRKGTRMIRKLIRRSFYTVLLIFILPALLSQAVWQATGNEARSWNTANWSSAGILPAVTIDTDAVIYVIAAKTGRWKGGFSVHSWIVTKEANGEGYNRYEVVGWGTPLRVNAYAPDARWYSNEPEIIHVVRGQEATNLIPEIENAVRTYPHAERGHYKLWPGPNSNSFIAHVLNEVPEIGGVLPANAVGRDYLSQDRFYQVDPDWMNIQLTYKGYAGFALGKRSGIEVNLFGLTAGLDIMNPAIKLPGFGRVSF
jgi:hypothetical protein